MHCPFSTTFITSCSCPWVLHLHLLGWNCWNWAASRCRSWLGGYVGLCCWSHNVAHYDKRDVQLLDLANAAQSSPLAICVGVAISSGQLARGGGYIRTRIVGRCCWSRCLWSATFSTSSYCCHHLHRSLAALALDRETHSSVLLVVVQYCTQI
jgi:hypothetical protein